MEVRQGFTRGLDYAAVVAASERVAWRVGEIVDGRTFDPSGPIVPASWVGTQDLAFLDARAQRTLNHGRAFSYVHLLGHFEEFAPVHLSNVIRDTRHDDRAQLRALMRFGDEELKHQQLFRQAERVLEESCGHAFGRWFEADNTRLAAMTESILEHDPLAIYLMVLALEWGTQRHYIESIHRDGGPVEPLYVEILKAHWIEEAQHVKTDLLEIARVAAELTETELAGAFDELLAIAALVDQAFAGQAACEVETLARVSGRAFGKAETERLYAALYRSLAEIMAGVGLSHATFVRVARPVPGRRRDARAGLAVVEGARRDERGHRGDQRLGIDGLPDVRVEAGAERAVAVEVARMAGERDRHELAARAVERAELAHERVAVLVGHGDVAHDDVGRLRLHRGQRFGRRRRDPRARTGQLEHDAERAPRVGIVLDDEHLHAVEVRPPRAPRPRDRSTPPPPAAGP